MRIIDLSHQIHPGMPVYPGTEPPVFAPAKTLEEHGYIEMKLTMFSHTGTHIDAPSHILLNAPSLDDYPFEHFAGRGLVLNFKEIGGRDIKLENLVKFKAQISEIDYLFIYSGWEEYWGKDQFFTGYPVLAPDAAGWLAENFSLKGVGTDTISVDCENDSSFPVHRTLLSRGILVIENLANLDRLLGSSFLFCCFPLKTLNADGSPVRAAAFLD